MMFSINGVKCQVALDENSLRWWRVSTSQKAVATNSEHYQNQQDEQSGKKLRKIELSQIIAIRKPPTDSMKEPQAISSRKNDKVIDKKLDKIKIYYAKQNHNNSTGKLLKLAKLSIVPTNQLHSSNQQPESDSETKTDFIIAFKELAEQLARELDLRRRQRPKRLLVFANPFGGKGKAVQLFRGQVRHLFDLAEIEAKLVITKHANHARETIEDPQFNVEYFDGIICVGGDGMFSELMNGLLFRYNRAKILTAQHADRTNQISELSAGEKRSVSPVTSEASSGFSNQSNSNDNDGKASFTKTTLHFDDMQSAEQQQQQQQLSSDQRQLAQLRLALGGIGQQFISPPIPVGVIGAGSTDANSFGLIGTNDVITATLNIILGNQIKIDVCSIHSYQEDNILRFVSTFVAYGYFGDVIRESEKLRWLGPSRYDVTGVNNLIKNRTYKGMVKILVSGKDGTPMKNTERCHANCKQCHLTVNHEFNNQYGYEMDKEQEHKQQQLAIERANHDDLKFLKRRGAFIGVNAAVTACRCPQTKKGFSPSNHLANGCADLILVRPCTRMQYIQYLLRTGWTKMSAFDLKYVEAYRCRQFEFVVEDQGTMTISKEINSSTSSNSSSSCSVDDGLASSLDSKQSSQLASGLIGDTFSSWNVDGELLNVQSIRVKINNQLLRVFGTGEPLIHAK